MKRPAPSSIVVFVVVLLVAAAIVVGVGLGTDGATAVTVGDQKVSGADMNRELAQWADFDAARARATEGAVTGDASAAIATQVVYELLANQFLDRTGERVTGEDRAAAQDSVVGSEQFADLSEWFQRRYLARGATFAALTRVVGEDDQGTGELRVLRKEARRTGVSVDPTYGRYAPLRVRVLVYPTPFTPAQG